MTNLLAAQAVNFSVGKVPILHSVDAQLRPGEMLGLIGPNGAGKSTLLKILAGVLQQRSGEVLYRDRLLAQCSRMTLAREIGYLAQGARAHWPLSVQKVVELGRLPWLGYWQQPDAQHMAIVDRAIARAEVVAYRNRDITTLSGGEQTLVMLARILATEPKVILADEPVAALDPYHQLHVMEMLREHARGENGVVVVLHDLSLAARFCDRLCLLRHGEVFTTGTPADVLTNANLAEVYGIEGDITCSANGVSVVPVKRVRDGHP